MTRLNVMCHDRRKIAVQIALYEGAICLRKCTAYAPGSEILFEFCFIHFSNACLKGTKHCNLPEICTMFY